MTHRARGIDLLLQNAFILLHTPHLRAVLQLQRDLRANLRVSFLHAALDLGLLAALQTPSAFDEIHTRLGVQRRDLLQSLLDLGVALKELVRESDRYRLRGARARALASADGDFLAAWLRESVEYHGSAYRHLAGRIHGAELGDYLSVYGDVIARSSRLLEPLMAGFARRAARSGAPARLLEIGCGSGVYLRYAAEANPGLTGLAIDLQEVVAAQARANLAAWGLAGRFVVELRDVLAPPPEWAGAFDLVTLYNNIYYFPVEDRVDLLRTLRSFLRPGGRLALVSAFQSSNPEGINFDLILRSTRGCAPLPKLDELQRQLEQAGFISAKVDRLAAGDWFYGLLAHVQDSD
jgi:4-hydroxy-2,2'-bipyrrole-5-carbaldehyde O-methyltransferase